MKTFCATLFLSVIFSQFSNAQQQEKYVEQSPVIAKLIELKKNMGINPNVDKVYTIQIFSGREDSAKDALNKTRGDHPEWICTLVHEYPNYKIKIGKYRSRLEADKALIEVKTDYPNAFVIAPTK